MKLGEYAGVIRVPRQVFRRFFDGSARAERCLEVYRLERTRFERIAERKAGLANWLTMVMLR